MSMTRAQIDRVRHDALHEAVEALMRQGHEDAARVVARMLPRLPWRIERGADGMPARMVWSPP
jgi:hypothetical protein